MRNRRWALLAVLLVIMVAMSGCFGGVVLLAALGELLRQLRTQISTRQEESFLLRTLSFLPQTVTALARRSSKSRGYEDKRTTDYKGHFQLTGIVLVLRL